MQQPVEVVGVDRWLIYRRLQELNIPCECHAYGPLTVECDSAITLLQLWSVLRHVRMQRTQLIEWLEQCWHTNGDDES
jgi:hypothetical protein